MMTEILYCFLFFGFFCEQIDNFNSKLESVFRLPLVYTTCSQNDTNTECKLYFLML